MSRLVCFVAGVFVALSSAFPVEPARAVPVGLDNFYSSPSVSVADDGASATLREDPGLGVALLSNDPFLGEPNVIVPSAGTVLSFKYDFRVVDGPRQDDIFRAFVIDANTGRSAGPAFDFATQQTQSGSIHYDLSSLTGRPLGLQFQLSSLARDPASGSIATVSDLRLEPRVVSTPDSLVLMLLAASGLIPGMGRRTH